MKLPREVVIRIRPNGKVEIETFGFVGSSCAEVAEFLERLLAGENPEEGDIQRDLKPEYYLAEQESEIDVRDRGSGG
jgi:hypothetical protein